MAKQKKIDIVAELKDKLSRAKLIVVTDYRGLPAKKMTELRRQLDSADAEYQVIKNTLARLAAREVAKDKVTALFEGPAAIAFGYGDEVKLSKSLVEYARTPGTTLQIKGGMLGSRVLAAKEVAALAALPPREVLLAQLVGQVKYPLQALHNVLSAPMRGLAVVLQQRVRQLEKGASQGAA